MTSAVQQNDQFVSHRGPYNIFFLVHALSSIVHSTEACNVLLGGPLALQLHPYECFSWINFHKRIFPISSVSCHLVVDL